MRVGTTQCGSQGSVHNWRGQHTQHPAQEALEALELKRSGTAPKSSIHRGSSQAGHSSQAYGSVQAVNERRLPAAIEDALVDAEGGHAHSVFGNGSTAWGR